jgi:hypothetical protein
MIQEDAKMATKTPKTAAGSKRRVSEFKSLILGFLLAFGESWS